MPLASFVHVSRPWVSKVLISVSPAQAVGTEDCIPLAISENRRVGFASQCHFGFSVGTADWLVFSDAGDHASWKGPKDRRQGCFAPIILCVTDRQGTKIRRGFPNHRTAFPWPCPRDWVVAVTDAKLPNAVDQHNSPFCRHRLTRSTTLTPAIKP